MFERMFPAISELVCEMQLDEVLFFEIWQAIEFWVPFDCGEECIMLAIPSSDV
jgi:hypothetical protein